MILTMAIVSKNLLAGLLVFTIILSLLGTLVTLSAINNYSRVPVSNKDVESAKVSVIVAGPPAPPAPPAEITGQVGVVVVPS
jgi:hypothetical protein